MARWSRYNPPLLVAVVGTVLVSPAASRPSCADPPHFRLEQLATGVWAAVATPGGYAICNMGIVDLGDRIVLIDAGMKPRAAAVLAAAAR